jgi:hypothetical protein
MIFRTASLENPLAWISKRGVMDENLNVISDVQRDGYIRSKAYPSKAYPNGWISVNMEMSLQSPF